MKNFERRVSITRDARFEAYRRMKRRKLSSTVSLAMLSLCIIFFNILQLLESFKEYNDSITATTIMLSSLVLTMSLLVTSLNYSEKEHQYYECAIKLSKLVDKIKIINNTTPEPKAKVRIFFTLARKYHSIIAECPINHIGIDYKRALERNDGIKSRCESNMIWFQWNVIDVNFLYWLLAVCMPFVAWRMIFVWKFAL